LYGVGQLAGSTGSQVWGLSGDGQVAVGIAFFPAPVYTRPIRWTLTTGSQQLATIGEAYATNYDGSISCGDGPSGVGACRFLPGGVIESIPGLPSSLGPGLSGSSRCLAISPDGSAVAGSIESISSSAGFVWTASGGSQVLPTLPGNNWSRAYGVSGDGSVVVGESYYHDLPPGPGQTLPQAVAWFRPTGTIANLNAGSNTGARAVTPDGAYIVGRLPNTIAFRWTSQGGLQTLPNLHAGTAISADGQTVAGFISGSPQANAAIWTPTLGAVNLNTYLPTIGISVTGWQLEYVMALSADGRVIAGRGWHNGVEEGWVVRLPSPCYANCDGSTTAPILNVNDYVCFNTAYAAGCP